MLILAFLSMTQTKELINRVHQTYTEPRVQAQQLDSVKLSVIFEQAKSLIKVSGDPILQENSHHNQNRLRIISQYILRRLKSRQIMETKKFIGLFSIFTYVITSERPHSLRFPLTFYKNLKTYTQAVIQFCGKQNGPIIGAESNKFLNTFFYSLITLCENQDKLGNLDLKKILCASTIKALLRLEINDDEKSMRLYRVLVLHLFEKREKCVPIELFLKSLLHHFVHCHSSRNTDAACIFLLNKLLERKKIDISSNLSEVPEKIIKIIVFKETSLHLCRLGFSLLLKLIEKKNNLVENLLTVDQLLHIVNRLYVQSPTIEKLHQSFIYLLTTLPEQHAIYLYRELTKNWTPTLLTLSILKCLTQRPSQGLVLELVNSSFWWGLVQYSEGDAPHAHKQLLHQIIMNCIKEPHMGNQALSQALASMLQWREHEFAIPAPVLTDLF